MVFGALKDGEVWCLVGSPTEFEQTAQFRRLNLETGHLREDGIEIKGVPPGPKKLTTVGNDLYLSTHTQIFRVGKQRLEEIGAKRREASAFVGRPFEYQNRLAAIVSNDDVFQLIQWNDEQWIDGPRIAVPRHNQIWRRNPLTGEQTLVLQPNSSAGLTRRNLSVVRWNDEYHLLLQSLDRTFAVYRRGFEFLETKGSIASALVPENCESNAGGWEPIPSYDGAVTAAVSARPYAELFATRDGIFLMVQQDLAVTRSAKFFRPMSERAFEEVSCEFDANSRSDFRVFAIAADPQEPVSYLIRESHHETDAGAVSRIEQNSIRAEHLLLQGHEASYYRRWKGMMLGFLIAWISHWIVILLGATALTSKIIRCPYEFGLERTALAPIWRRGLAWTIDTTLSLGVLMASAQWWMSNGHTELRWPDEVDRHQSLFHIELILYWFITEGESPLGRLWMVTNPVAPLLDSLPGASELLGLLVAALIVQYIPKVWLECHHGLTPGKWLLRIRSVRSTLRPARLARVIVRDALICCDVLCLLTPLPAAISLVLSGKAQRLGDRAADTVVVEAS